MPGRRLEEELKYWRRHATVFTPERGDGLAERLEALASASQLASALLQVVNILNILQLFPEFWDFMWRIGEIWSMPPETVRLLYPELFNGSIIAFSVAATVHTMVQWVHMSMKRQVIPVFKGAWRVAYTVSFSATIVACLLAFIVTKSPLALTYIVIFALAMPYTLSARYARVAEEINRLAAAEGGGGR